jgi:hypothetical protein
MNMNPLTWNWNQAKAAGKHVVSFGAGATAFAVMAHFISPAAGTGITQNINDVFNGLEQAATGIAGLISALILIYTSLRSANNASPASQVASVKAAEPAVLVQAVQEVSPSMLRDAVAAQPEVKAVVVKTQAAADASPNPKVTT